MKDSYFLLLLLTINIARENRLFSCKNDVQTIWHVFTDCTFTLWILGNQGYENLSDIFADERIHLLSLTRMLKIPIGRM